MYGLSAVFQVMEDTDATLSDLSIVGTTDGQAIELSPAFYANTFTYTASVANGIDAVTLSATKNDSNSTVVITNDDDANTPDTADPEPHRRLQHPDGHGNSAGRNHQDLHGHANTGRINSTRRSDWPHGHHEQHERHQSRMERAHQQRRRHHLRLQGPTLAQRSIQLDQPDQQYR